MKVTNWWRKLMASIVAGGALAPGMSYAVNIPLGDPSFDVYTVPANPGYAYAAPPNGTYRPTSAWVDDLDNPPGYTQDDGASNWLYDSAYAEATAVTKRPAPRTGNQAMHGLFNYSAQETSAVFEANKTYTYSLWAQNDELLNETNGVFLYVFDGTVPFSDTNSLEGTLFTAINKRGAGMSAAQSQANWSLLNIRHTVFPGAPEIGHPVGVGFFARKDSAVDDAALQSDPSQNVLLALEINTTNGQARIRNQTGAAVNIDYYEIKSTTGALNATTWNSLQDQNLPGFPAGNGSGNGWEQAGGSNANVLSESYLTGSSAVGNSATVGLGTAFSVAGTQDLTFRYGQLTGAATSAEGDYNNNGVVDAADYVLWRNGGPLQNDPSPGVQASDYDFWRARFGNTGGVPSGPSTLLRGPVFYVTSFSGSGSAVPEPAGVILVGIGAVALVLHGRKREASICEKP